MPENNREEKALGFLGLATRAGRVIAGVPLICTALQKGKKEKTPVLVLLAADASQNTQKRVTDRTAYYSVPLIRLSVDGATLALRVGKRDGTVAAVGITEPSLAQAIMNLYHE
jgi:ribosomal protein L7Ae-like RNA K-turn-binding protein